MSCLNNWKGCKLLDFYQIQLYEFNQCLPVGQEKEFKQTYIMQKTTIPDDLFAKLARVYVDQDFIDIIQSEIREFYVQHYTRNYNLVEVTHLQQTDYQIDFHIIIDRSPYRTKYLIMKFIAND